MPIKCSSGKKARFRFKKGTNIRLAFCGNEVVEAVKVKRKRQRRSRKSRVR